MGLFDDLQGTSTGGGSRLDRSAASGEKIGTGKKSVKTGAGRVPTNKGKAKQEIRKNPAAGSPVDIVDASGATVGVLPSSVDDVARLLPSWVDSWCSVHAVPDMRKASPLIFRAMCQGIGDIVKKSRILKDDTRTAAGACVGSTCNRYNPAAVMALYDIFTAFCGDYDKIPFQTTFAAFCGVSLSYVREYTQELTASGLDIAKKTHGGEMDAIRQKTSGDPVGRLAILNNEFYGGGGTSGDVVQVSQNVPSERVFGLIGENKLD